MRLDKFLKVSRIIKRRSVAKEIIDRGNVKINKKIAKAASEIKVNDQIEIDNVGIFEVLKICEFAKEEDAKLMYRKID